MIELLVGVANNPVGAFSVGTIGGVPPPLPEGGGVPLSIGVATVAKFDGCEVPAAFTAETR